MKDLRAGNIVLTPIGKGILIDPEIITEYDFPFGMVKKETQRFAVKLFKKTNYKNNIAYFWEKELENES